MKGTLLLNRICGFPGTSFREEVTLSHHLPSNPEKALPLPILLKPCRIQPFPQRCPQRVGGLEWDPRVTGLVPANPASTTRWRCNFTVPSWQWVWAQPQTNQCSLQDPLDLNLWEDLYEFFPDLGAPEQRACLLGLGP